MGGDQNMGMAVGFNDGHQLVALVQIDGAQAVLTDIFQQRHIQTLGGAVFGNHGQLQIAVADVAEVQHRLYPLVGFHLNHIDHGDALGRLAAFGYLIALLAVDLTRVGEEQQVIVGGGGEHIGHIVLLTGGDALLPHAALALGAVLTDGCALDIAVLRQRIDALLLLDEILDVDLILHILNLGLAVVTELVGDGLQLFL